MTLNHLIGNTPLIALPRDGGRLFAKLESRNPAGSVKDRAALSMLRDARKKGALEPGGRILEATSGNTGIALAALASAEGYSCTIVMPENMSRERVQLLQAYGAEVILTPAAEGMTGATAEAQKMAAKCPNIFYVNQFENPANPLAHYRTTGPEIWQQSGKSLDIFVAGVGTGGTISGVGLYLKAQNPRIRVVAVEPASGESIPGIGAGFLPPILDQSVIDIWIPVTRAQAVEAARDLARTQGILAGISSGAALHAAYQLAALPENRGNIIATLLPDSGERYLSTGLLN